MERLMLVTMYKVITTSVDMIQGSVFDMHDEDKSNCKAWMEKGKKSEDRMVPIEKASIRDIQFGFDNGMDELLERLPLIELLIPERVKRDENALSQLDFLCKRQEKEDAELPVIPMAYYLNYLYDYGDGWEVKVTLTDLYYTKTRWDVVKECDVRSRTFVAKVDDKAFLEDTTAYDMNNQSLEYEYAKKVATVHYKKKPTCVALDGMCVMDDVGGMGGYIDFLQNLKHWDPEERKELRDWATYMGWTSKLPKPESLLWSLVRCEVISMDDLEEFSDETKETIERMVSW